MTFLATKEELTKKQKLNQEAEFKINNLTSRAKELEEKRRTQNNSKSAEEKSKENSKEDKESKVLNKFNEISQTINQITGNNGGNKRNRCDRAPIQLRPLKFKMSVPRLLSKESEQ